MLCRFFALSVDWWCFFCFVKQKTAYELRISDWSSDVCSADLPDAAPQRRAYISAERELFVPGHDRRSGGNRPLLECYRRQWRPGKPVRLVQGQMGPVLADNPAPAHGYLFRP